LTQRLGLARAMALAMTGDKLPAAQAKEWGLIWDVADDCLAAAWPGAAPGRHAHQSAGGHPHLLREAKHAHPHQQLDVERDTQSAMGRTHDYIEGVTAFLQKRTAQFRGE
jgi:2-(1,2-epoxy-1,2-dihydrophenyl)acetyl-CoA isomerase